MSRFAGLLGIVVLLFLAYVFSTDRKAIRLKTVLWGLGLQFIFAILVVYFTWGQWVMAEAGGGIFYEVERLTDLAGAYEQVVADLGTVYSLAYRPSNKTRDGKWRAIKITVNRSNAVARGKRGYYAN